jgi:hypothetical protein
MVVVVGLVDALDAVELPPPPPHPVSTKSKAPKRPIFFIMMGGLVQNRGQFKVAREKPAGRDCGR